MLFLHPIQIEPILKSNFSGSDLIDRETLDNLINLDISGKLGSNLSSISNENSMTEGVKTILTQFETIKKVLESKKEWVNFSKEMRLTDLFEIIYGIPEQSNLLKPGEGKPVKFLKTSLRKISSNEQDYIIRSSKSEPKIDNKYVIRANDILINTKGAPKVSQAEKLESDAYTFVPSHQFILLRPRPILKDLENQISRELALPLVRFSLQILLMKKYNEAKSKFKKPEEADVDEMTKLTKKKSLTVLIPALKLKDLESIVLNIPDDSQSADQLSAILQMYDFLEVLYGKLFDLETKIGENIINFNQSKYFSPYQNKEKYSK
jgi:hypothetical protein